MLEVMKRQTTAGLVSLEVEVPEGIALAIEQAIQNAVDEARSYTPEEVHGITTYGDLIRGARFREGMTQAALAKTIGVSRSYLSDLEHCRRPLSVKMAKAIGKATRVSWTLFVV
jgi:DNA-binding XRE family transcriptional regulator